MPSNRLTFAALAAACIGAAGVGGYFASRQNAIPAPAAASSPAATTASAPADRPVQETEAVVGDVAKAPVVTPPAAPVSTEPTTTKRAEPAKNAVQSGKAPVTAARQAPAPQDRPLPAAGSVPATAAQTPTPAPAIPDPTTTPKVDDHASVQDPSHAPDPPPTTFEELVISANSVIGLQTETRLSSETARVEDRVEARITRDVKVGTAIAIPAGSRAMGSVTLVERGGKFKERARLGIRFNTLVLSDGTRIPMSTETIYRDGEAPGNGAASKVGGGAAAGAILGAILGGAKGAAIGATVGAGGGAAVVENGDRAAATLPAGTPLTVRLLTPVTLTVEQK